MLYTINKRFSSVKGSRWGQNVLIRPDSIPYSSKCEKVQELQGEKEA